MKKDDFNLSSSSGKKCAKYSHTGSGIHPLGKGRGIPVVDTSEIAQDDWIDRHR